VLRLLASSELLLLLVNVVTLALWTALPALLLAYGRQSVAMRHMRPEFSLRPSEAAELDRAVRLYERVRLRLDDIDARRPPGLWRALFLGQADAERDLTGDCENLQAYAHHLRATIVRLRGLPLERLRTWVHLASTRFALGNAALVHVETFVMFVAAFYFSRQFPWATSWAAPWTDKLTADMGASGMAAPLVWYPFDARIFHANAAAAIIAALLSPLFYLLRRSNLHDAHGLEFHVLTALAEAEPDQKVRQPLTDFVDKDLADKDLADKDLADKDFADIDFADIDLADNDMSAADTRPGADGSEPWFAVLGVARSASMEQVTEAYKVLIKQSHPDRVQGLSPAIRNVAEAEAKRLNVAYEQAQASLT
jgi:DnaJ-domain-containing protein 1